MQVVLSTFVNYLTACGQLTDKEESIERPIFLCGKKEKA